MHILIMCLVFVIPICTYNMIMITENKTAKQDGVNGGVKTPSNYSNILHQKSFSNSMTM